MRPLTARAAGSELRTSSSAVITGVPMFLEALIISWLTNQVQTCHDRAARP